MKNVALKYLDAVARIEREISMKAETEEYQRTLHQLRCHMEGISYVLEAEIGNTRSKVALDQLADAQKRIYTVNTALAAERVRLLNVLKGESVLASSKIFESGTKDRV